MRSGPPALLAISVLSFLVAACGGSNAARLASTPPSAPAPTPTPTPAPPTAVLEPYSVALESSTPFVTYVVAETDTFGADPEGGGYKDVEKLVATQPGTIQQSLAFTYDTVKGTYTISLPDGTPGELVQRGLGGSLGSTATASFHHISDHENTIIVMPVPQGPHSPYTYSHFGSWEQLGITQSDGSYDKTFGLFVYGLETPASAVPRSGTATYHAELRANSPMDWWEVTGDVHLAFDFAQGALSGWMHPVFYPGDWYPDQYHDYGRYDFAETIYSVGSSRYSGTFAKDGTVLSGSFFDGSLTGPAAEEVIGRFVAPFVRNGTTGNLSGIWVGKKN